MKSHFSVLFKLCIGLLFLSVARLCLAGEDWMLSNKFGEVTVEIFIPGDGRALAGLLTETKAGGARDTRDCGKKRWSRRGSQSGAGYRAPRAEQTMKNKDRNMKDRNMEFPFSGPLPVCPS